MVGGSGRQETAGAAPPGRRRAARRPRRPDDPEKARALLLGGSLSRGQAVAILADVVTASARLSRAWSRPGDVRIVAGLIGTLGTYIVAARVGDEIHVEFMPDIAAALEAGGQLGWTVGPPRREKTAASLLAGFGGHLEFSDDIEVALGGAAKW